MGSFHERAFILSTGDEIVTGQLQDTNAKYFAERLMDAGVLPVEHAAVQDSLADLVAALRRGIAAAPLVIMSGGLGPTDGDLTRQALCELLGDTLVLDEGARTALTDKLARRGRDVTERQLRQVFRPSRARCLDNEFGTAPGLHVVARVEQSQSDRGAADIFCLPGPPGELQPMFEREVLPHLRLPPGHIVLTRLAHVVGIAEADCVTKLGDLTRRDVARLDGEPRSLVGITASGGILTLRMRCEGQTGAAAAAALLDEAEARARGTLGEHLFAIGTGPGAEQLAATVIAHLKRERQTLATAESCTGGMLGQIITAIPGASGAYVGGFITYANAQKVTLGVEAAAIEAHGAVAAEVASQMAARALERTGASHALAITGVAGPDGGSEAKPVGTVYIARASKGASVSSRRFHFTGNRDDVRRRASVTALAMLYFHMRPPASGPPRLLWEVG